MARDSSQSKSTSLVEKLQLLAGVSFFGGLEERDRRDLATLSQLRRARAGDVVVREGSEGTALFVVAYGHLKIETEAGAADPVVFDILGSGDIFGELALFTGRPRAANVVALEDCELLATDYRDLRAFIERRPPVAMALLANLAHRIVDFGDSVRAFAVAGLEARLARRLCVLSQRQADSDGDPARLDFHLTQRDWARMAGVSREAINRQFRAWSDQGWIRVHDGAIEILDPGALRRLAGMSGLLSG